MNYRHAFHAGNHSLQRLQTFSLPFARQADN